MSAPTLSVSRGFFAGLNVGQIVFSIGPMLLARLCLRRAQHVGSWVRTYRRPRIRNRGRVEVGSRTTICSRRARTELSVHSGARLEIGRGVFIDDGVAISAHERVRIGDGSHLGAHAILTDTERDETDPVWSAPVELGRNVWLGAHVTVLRGVSIGDNAVVGAGSVVSEDVPADSLAAGVPARVVRRFDPSENTADRRAEADGHRS